MARPAARKTQWTVMVYLAGDNNLDAAGTADLLEMKRVGSTDRVTLLAQFDRSGAGRATNRYLLRKNTPLADDVVTALGETDTGDPAILRDFVTWAAAQHPARHYLLVLWNHGSGWDDSNLYQGDYFSGAGLAQACGDTPPDEPCFDDICGSCAGGSCDARGYCSHGARDDMVGPRAPGGGDCLFVVPGGDLEVWVNEAGYNDWDVSASGAYEFAVWLDEGCPSACPSIDWCL